MFLNDGNILFIKDIELFSIPRPSNTMIVFKSTLPVFYYTSKLKNLYLNLVAV